MSTQCAVDNPPARSLKLAQSYPEALLNRAIARLQQGDLAGAGTDFSEAIGINPMEAHAYVGRAEARRAAGDVEGAITDATHAVRLDASSADALNTRGAIRLDLGDYPGALADAEAAIRLDPALAAGCSTRGAARLALGDRAGAAADCDSATVLAPHRAEFQANIGAVRHTRRDLPGAVAAYDRAIELNPRLGWVYALRGNARYHLTDPVLMRADYRRAFELDPRLAARTIVRALTRLADEDLNTQLASCEDHLLLAPEDPFSHARRGLLLVLLGRDAEARKDFEAFAAQEPEGANYLPELIAAAEWYRKRATGTKPKSGIAAPPTQAPASPPDISSDLVGQEDEHILGFGLMVG